MLTTKLKPCVHCNRHPYSATGDGIRGPQVLCMCGARGPIGQTVDDAARRWNTRSIASAEATIREANGEATPQ